MERIQYLNIPPEKKPVLTDQIAVYNAGTTDLVAGLKKMDGTTALANPFAVGDAGTVDDWGFMPPSSGPYDVKNTTSPRIAYLGRFVVFTPPAASQAQAEDSAGTTILSWASQRIWQAIAKWGATAASVFSGVFKGVSGHGVSVNPANGATVTINHADRDYTHIDVSALTNAHAITLAFSNLPVAPKLGAQWVYVKAGASVPAITFPAGSSGHVAPAPNKTTEFLFRTRDAGSVVRWSKTDEY